MKTFLKLGWRNLFPPSIFTTGITTQRPPRRHAVRIIYGLGVLMLFFGPRSPAQQNPGAASNTVNQASYVEVSRGPHSRVMQAVVTVTNAAGNTVTRTNAYTEIATGMSHLVGDQWVASSDQIQITANGAAGTNCQAQIHFAANLNNPGAIDLLTPDGFHMTSDIAGLVYFDGITNVVIAIPQDSIGQILPSLDQILYTNAFTNAACDVLYSYTKAGFEQNIVIRQQLPSPASFGLTASNIWLQVWTEFTAAPSPQISQPQGEGTDPTLDFGVIKMGKGKAFMLGNNATSVPVTKQWVSSGGRTFLIESVLLNSLAAQLQQLPSGSSQGGGQSKLHYPHPLLASSAPPHQVLDKIKLPVKKVAKKSTTPMQLARSNPVRQGLVLDYNLSSGETNLTLQADTTYYVSGPTYVWGVTTIEGGTVIKYTNDPSATIIGSTVTTEYTTNWVCKTDKFRPALFCAKDDDSVGIPISGSSGSPSGYYGGTALQIQKAVVGTNTLKNLRFSNLQTALDLEEGNFSLYHCQFINCGVGLHLDSVVFYLGNALFSNVATNFYCVPEPCYATLENITVDPGTVNTRFCTLEGYEDYPWDNPGGDGPEFSMSIANSLFSGLGSSQMGLYAQVDNMDPLVPLPNTVFSSGVGDFQSVGAGNYYLAANTYQGAGTASIDPVLLADLQQKTTHPPLWLTNNFTLNTNLMPQALRDTNSSPDLGYHYDPIDFLSSCTVSDATLTLSSGVVIAYYNETCISLLDGAQLNSQGSATNRNYFVHYRLVQEQATNIWVGEATTDAVRCACPLNFSSGTDNCPSATLRFTTVAALAGEVDFFLVEEGGVENFSMRDCEIYEAGAVYEMYPTGTYNLLNNLFSYFNGILTGVADQLCLTNNTFVGGANTSVSIQGASIFNNAFDVPYGVEYYSDLVAAGQ